MSVVTTVARAALTVLRREPVAVWGIALAAVLTALAAAGVSTTVTTTIGAVVSLLGVPVVRGQVTPTAALKALVAGARGEKPTP